MKKGIFINLLFISTFWGGAAPCQVLTSSDHDYGAVLSNTLVPYFKALKAGDVDAIKYYISGNLYEKYRILLDHNKEYPSFLRSHFKNAKFLVKRVEKINNEIFVEIEAWFENGSYTNQKLVFAEELGKPAPTWKVVRQSMQ